MTDSASSSDTTYRQSLHQALHASRILTGALDDELDIQKSTKTTKLGAQHQEENQAALNNTLSDRLKQAVAACDDLSSFATDPNPQTTTGDVALHLLSLIHTYLIEKRNDTGSRVAVQDERLTSSLKRQGVQPKEDVGLGVKDVKLITTLQTLASKWALSTRIRAYDETLFSLAPNGFPRAQGKEGSTKLTTHNRFEEVDEDAEVRDRARARQAFDTARKDLYGVVDKWMVTVAAHNPTSFKASVNTTTDVVTVMLRVGIVDYLSALLRLGFGPSVTSNASAASQTSSTMTKDAIQKRTAAATTQLLRFLSTHSAMSSLSSVIAHSDAKRGAPSFVKAVSSRLLSAQLLRPDGVRSLFIITFGGADAAEAAVELEGQSQETGTAAPGTNSLKRFEQCARLLLTPPQGMPVEVYLPIILPNLLDVLAPDLSTSSNITPPPQEQMRAAGFVLTRISEQHPTSFFDAMHDRVYSKFNPSMETTREAYTTGASANAEADSIVAVSPEQLDRAVSTLSSFLLFSEPSPRFLTMLFEPILPQLLTLHDHLQVPKQAVGKGKVRSVEIAGQTDRLKAEISNFLRTWARLVDLKHGAASLLRSIKSAEKGIGCEQPASNDEALGFFWSSEPDGVSIRFGTDSSMAGQDLSALLKDLSLATLADQLKTGMDDELDLTKVAPDLSAKLGLRPDPRLVAMLLKTAGRKDLAQILLPAVLNVYMAQKSAAKARVSGEDKISSLGTQSVLYLQLILQLLDAFGSDLLQGDVPATLAFIDFSLSSPSQRQVMPQPQQGEAAAGSEEGASDDMPFISAKSSTSKSSVSSLFNVAAESPTVPMDSRAADKESVDVEDDGEEDDEELVSTALSLLLSLLESDTSLSSETQPMLLVIADKIEHHLDSSSSEIRSLAKEAKLVLLARRSSIRGSAPDTSTATNETSSKALAYAQAQETYQEALKLLQDPILPVRAHGLVLLRRLVSDDTKNGGQHVDRVDPALVPAILDIFLHAVQDEESYLYLNAVQGLAALASSGGGQTISRLVGVYIGRDDGLVSQGLGGREVEKRLRVGEALLQVIQRCADSMAAHVDAVVPPLLTRLRDRALPNVLRSSFVSILGTMIEAVPETMVVKGYASQLVQVCIDIVVIEMVRRPDVGKEGAVKLNVANKRVKDVDDEEKQKKGEEEQRRLDSATNADAKIAHLRRAAMLLLTLLVRGTRMQLENSGEGGSVVEKLSSLRLPGGGVLPSVSAPGDDSTGSGGESLKGKDLLFPPEMLKRLKQVAGYVQASDTDAVVRTHAHDCLEHVEALELDLLQSAVSVPR